MTSSFSRVATGFLMAITIMTGLSSALPTQAATTSTLIKGSTSTVYWYANDGKRYVFPNIKTFWSWFPTSAFKNVQTLKDSELATIPLGGNVVYRPGYRLVKSATNERVYTVSRYGVLHWVTTEQIAVSQYGYDWNTKIDDVPDEFFSNYTIGSPIYNTWDYNAGNEYNAVTTPNDNIVGMNSNYGSNSVTQNNVTVTVSNTSIVSGNAVTVTANTLDTSYATFSIYDERTGNLVQTCYNVGSCSTTQNITIRNNETSMRFYVIVNRNGNYSTTYSPYVYLSGTGSNTNQGYSITVNKTSISQGESVTVSIQITPPNYTTGKTALSIYDGRDGSLLKTCSTSEAYSCSLTLPLNSKNSESSMRFAIVLGYSAGTYHATEYHYSPYITFTNVTSNPSQDTTTNFDGTFNIDRTTINSGDRVNGSFFPTTYEGGIPSYTVYDERNNSVIKTCADLVCAFSQNVYRLGNETSMRLYIMKGSSSTKIYSPYISFTATNTNTSSFNSNTSITGSITSRYTDNNGENIVFAANVINPNTNVSNVTVTLYDQNNNQVLKTCAANTYCATTLTSWNQVTRTLYAKATDQTGAIVTSSPVTVTYGNNGNANVTKPVVTSPTQNQVITTNANQATINWNSTARRHQVTIECQSCNGYSNWTAPATTYYADNYQTSYVASLPSNQMQYRVHVKVLNDDGTTSDWSDYVYFTLTPTVTQNNNGTLSANTIMNLSRTSLSAQDTVNVSATVSGYNIPLNNLEIRLYDERDNRHLGTCDGQETCIVNTSAWSIAGQPNTFRYYAIVSNNATGQQLPFVYSPYITLTN